MLDQTDKVKEGAAQAPTEDGQSTERETAAVLSDYVRHAADYTRELADKLQTQKADELVAAAVTWTRKQPLLLVGGGVVVGLILSHLARNGRRSGGRGAEDAENRR